MHSVWVDVIPKLKNLSRNQKQYEKRTMNDLVFLVTEVFYNKNIGTCIFYLGPSISLVESKTRRINRSLLIKLLSKKTLDLTQDCRIIISCLAQVVLKSN